MHNSRIGRGIRLSCGFLCLLTAVLLWSPAYADTEEDVPSADGSPNNWSGAYSTVDETVSGADDNDSITTSSTSSVEIYTFSHTVPSDATVDSVQVNFRCKRASAGSKTVAAQIERSNTSATGGFETQTASYANYSKSWSLCPVSSCSNSTDGAWTVTDLDNLEIGVKSSSSGSGSLNCSQVSVTISYTPATSSRRIWIVD